MSDVDAVVDGLPRLLDAERLTSVDVYGHGLGAGLAHLLARRYPHRIRRLALSGFGLLSARRAAAARGVVDMLELLPPPAVRAHCMVPYERLAEQSDEVRAVEILQAASDQLDRHSRESSLCHMRLQAGLFRAAATAAMTRVSPLRTMLLFANDDPHFTRQEHDALEATYSQRNVVRYLNAGRSFALATAWDLEKKLEVFFRPETGALLRMPMREPLLAAG